MNKDHFTAFPIWMLLGDGGEVLHVEVRRGKSVQKEGSWRALHHQLLLRCFVY